MKTAIVPTEALWRFDYFKFTFPDSDHKLSARRFQQVEKAVNELMGDAPMGTYKEPKQTWLAPGTTRPNGLHIIEVWGVPAEALRKLPWHWVDYLTYAHVKSYAQLPEGKTYDNLLDLFNNPGYRKASRIVPPKRKHSVKQSAYPGLAIGSKKSSIHFAVYTRPGERIGVEARFTDEHLATARDNACVAVGEPDTNRSAGWLALLKFLVRKTYQELDYEFLSRDAEYQEFLVEFSTARRTSWSVAFHKEEPQAEPEAAELMETLRDDTPPWDDSE